MCRSSPASLYTVTLPVEEYCSEPVCEVTTNRPWMYFTSMGSPSHSDGNVMNTSSRSVPDSQAYLSTVSLTTVSQAYLYTCKGTLASLSRHILCGCLQA